MLFAETAPEVTNWLMVVMSLGASVISTALAGWTLYVKRLESKDAAAANAADIEERLKACEEDRAVLKGRIEHLEKMLGVPKPPVA